MLSMKQYWRALLGVGSAGGRKREVVGPLLPKINSSKMKIILWVLRFLKACCYIFLLWKRMRCVFLLRQNRFQAGSTRVFRALPKLTTPSPHRFVEVVVSFGRALCGVGPAWKRFWGGGLFFFVVFLVSFLVLSVGFLFLSVFCLLLREVVLWTVGFFVLDFIFSEDFLGFPADTPHPLAQYYRGINISKQTSSTYRPALNLVQLGLKARR